MGLNISSLFFFFLFFFQLLLLKKPSGANLTMTWARTFKNNAQQRLVHQHITSKHDYETCSFLHTLQSRISLEHSGLPKHHLHPTVIQVPDIQHRLMKSLLSAFNKIPYGSKPCCDTHIALNFFPVSYRGFLRLVPVLRALTPRSCHI